MKLTNGISLFNKQSSKVQKNRKNDILDKNCNFSIPIIENEISNQNKNFSKEKVTLLKSFYSKNEKTSKSKSKSNSHSKEYRRRNRSNLNYNNNFNNIKNKNVYYNNNTSYDNFPDMPLWNNGKKIGYGIKEMPAYKCDLKINELEKKRKSFWNYQKKDIKHTYQWNIIHQACVFPHIKSEEYLAEHGFKTVDGCINMCVDPKGNIFRVPNYCINDPYFEKELKEKLGGNDNKFINIDLFNVTKNEKNNINVSENTTGKELINLYKKMKNLEDNMLDIRLLYGGGIIREDETLYQHMVKDGDFIQVSIFKKN